MEKIKGLIMGKMNNNDIIRYDVTCTAGRLSHRSPGAGGGQSRPPPAARPDVRPDHLPPLPGGHHAVRPRQAFQHSNVKAWYGPVLISRKNFY